MNVAVLFSGGKDSSYVTQWCIDQSYTIKALVSIFPRRADSYMFHVPNIELTRLQAKAADLPHVIRQSSGIKDEEVKDLEAVIQQLDIDGIVSGAIASEYQRSHIEFVADKLGLRSINPLWHKDPILILKEMIKRDFNIIFAGVFALGFDESWLGRKLDESSLKDLITLNKKYGVNLSGEGGEYETLVLDAPFFKNTIKIIESEKIWQKNSGYLNVKRAELIAKCENL